SMIMGKSCALEELLAESLSTCTESPATTPASAEVLAATGDTMFILDAKVPDIEARLVRLLAQPGVGEFVTITELSETIKLCPACGEGIFPLFPQLSCSAPSGLNNRKYSILLSFMRT